MARRAPAPAVQPSTKNKLVASATRTNRYVAVQLAYGSEDILHPEFVKELGVTLKNEQNITLRSIGPLTALYANSDGFFKCSTVLSMEEQPVKAIVMVDTTDQGPLQIEIDVVEEANTITSRMA